jgi:hypothetical protein
LPDLIGVFVDKLNKVEQQLRIAAVADFYYPDGRDAIQLLLARVAKQRQQVQEARDYSQMVQFAILREANYLVIRTTIYLGIIVRCSSVRNAFELYVPFLDICKAIIGENARLILSSEWDYVPFTYPQTLNELPDFIVIGLPASESDNVLIFPAAGHELGHSLWRKNQLHDQLSPQVKAHVDAVLLKKRAAFEQLIPALKGVDLDQDLFAQYIRSQIFSSAMAQLEEIFSDFLGFNLFGESYLYGFEYLIAPSLGGHRNIGYPDTLKRVQIMQSFAKRLGINIPNYSSHFSADDPLSSPESLYCDAADEVVQELLGDLFTMVQHAIAAAGVSTPSGAESKAAEAAFHVGVPYEGNASIGDLINAAWRVYMGGDSKTFERQGSNIVDYVSDLVLKSVEMYELRKHLSDVG